KPPPSHKYGRTITSTTKDCFVNNLPEQFHRLSIPDNLEELDAATETIGSLFSSTLDAVAPLRLKKINPFARKFQIFWLTPQREFFKATVI
ncbi:MAG: hypothetical protein ACRCZO_17810, partial [Cetobacterium sp.]